MRFLQILLNWIVFLLPIVFLLFIYIAYLYIIALLKRRKAIKFIKRTCENCGYELTLKNTYNSVFKLSKESDMIIKTPFEDFYIRFISSIKKNENIHFVRKNIFRRGKLLGALYLNPKTAIARIFKPKNMDDHLFKWMHVDIQELPRGCSALKEIALPENAKEVYLFNPVPLNIFYIDKTVERRIAGGEVYDGIAFHDYSSLSLMLEQIKTKAENKLKGIYISSPQEMEKG